MKSTESTSSECKTKYQPQKNNSITISPLNAPIPGRKRGSSRKKNHRKSKSVEDEEDDFTVPTGGKHRRSYIKNCIKKRLNNNYEKQINLQDENVVFTDNKIYISLAARNSSLTSSLGGSNSLKKNRRVIYPTSGAIKLTGFLRGFDFNYESPTKKPEQTLTSAESEEKLKFNMLQEGSSKATTTAVVFEKVKIPPKNSPSFDEARSSYVHVTNVDDRNDDSILTSSTFVTEWNNCDLNSYEADDEDDVQWQNFLELRKQGKSINNDNGNCQTTLTLSDSGFGSQLFSNSCNIDRNLKSLETWLDDETYDNSFNEELEQKVSIMFPDLYKNNSPTAYYNNINNSNHEKKEKFS